ncbi:MAG: monovalent cation/H(+) antiporter subunit G [Pseudomonadota bacterium]
MSWWAIALEILSWFLIVGGSFFTLVGAIGLMRMPDLFTRLHAVSIIDTLGAMMLLLGLMIQAGPTLIAAKLAFIFVLLFFTGPVMTHAVAQAALHAGVEPELDEDRRETATPAPAVLQAVSTEAKE